MLAPTPQSPGFWSRARAAAQYAIYGDGVPGASFGAVRYGPSEPIGAGGWAARLVGYGRGDAGISVSESSARQFSAVYACVNRISNPIARFPLSIYQRGTSGGASEVKEHPLSDRLGLRPNDFMSSRTLRKTTQGHALCWGNGYCEIERNQRGEAVNLWPLLPWATQPVREDDRFFYRTNVNGQQFEVAHDDVIHIIDQTQDGYCGISVIAVARNAISLGLAAEKFGSRFFANDAKSGGFLLHPGKLGDPGKQNLEESFHKASTGKPGERGEGLDRAHRVKVLEEGMKFVQTTIPPEDAQFLETRGFQVEEIARFYDVPLIMLQSHDKTTSWGSGIEQLMIGFIRNTVDPWAHAWEQELNWKLFTERERAAGLYVKMNMNAYLRGDSAARAQFYKMLFEVAGITPNKICELEDFEPIGPLGDLRFVPANMQTLERAAAPPAAVAPPAIGAPSIVDPADDPAVPADEEVDQ